jgi:hypothetical protein
LPGAVLREGPPGFARADVHPAVTPRHRNGIRFRGR